MNRTLKRPMFRIGGSAGTGITSGLDTTKPKRGLVDEPGGYAGIDTDMKSILERTTAQVQDPKIRSLYQPYFERPKGESFNRFLMSTGLNLMSATPRGKGLTGLFATAGEAAKEPTAKLFEDIDSQRLSKKAAEADLFKTLLSGNVSIAESAAGNEAGAAKTYEKIVIADKLREIMPRFLELKEKRQKGTLEQGEEVELKLLQEDYNAFRKKDVGEEALIEIYVKSLGDRALPNRVEDLYREDLKSGERKYKGKDDPQIIKDAVDSIRRELQNLADGGRAGYQMGGGVDMAQQPMMMPQEPMTMDQGSIDDNKNNLISYDQLRARLPAEITDDIVELMSNSAEALEDFAMISSQQDVTQFNKKYSVNLVLPSEA